MTTARHVCDELREVNGQLAPEFVCAIEVDDFLCRYVLRVIETPALERAEIPIRFCPFCGSRLPSV